MTFPQILNTASLRLEKFLYFISFYFYFLFCFFFVSDLSILRTASKHSEQINLIYWLQWVCSGCFRNRETKILSTESNRYGLHDITEYCSYDRENKDAAEVVKMWCLVWTSGPSPSAAITARTVTYKLCMHKTTTALHKQQTNENVSRNAAT